VLKFQAVAEKNTKDARGYFILPHPVECIIGLSYSRASEAGGMQGI